MRASTTRSLVPSGAGAFVGIEGLGFLALGLWGRGEVRRALARERITSTGDASPAYARVTGATAARSMAEVIRRNTVDATGGLTYAEIGSYLDGDGRPTADAAVAVKDERTGQPLEHPDHQLWIQSTTLQTALMQAYMGFRVAELTIAVGASLIAIGLGLTAVGRSLR
jgi:hypothetical protein